MLSKKVQLNYLKRIFLKLEKHLRGFTLTGDQKSLHGFRVEVKKFKSLIELASYSSKINFSKDFEDLKKIYARSGKIRDTFLHLEKTKDHADLKNYFEREEKTLKEFIDAFRESLPRLNHHLQKSYKKAIKIIKIKKRSSVKFFYRQLLEKILLQLAKNEFTEEMHQSRKLIKHLLHNQKLSEELYGKKIRLNFFYLEKLQELIGKWHDQIVSIELLKQKNTEIPSELLESERALQGQITKLSESFWQKVNAKNTILFK